MRIWAKYKATGAGLKDLSFFRQKREKDIFVLGRGTQKTSCMDGAALLAKFFLFTGKRFATAHVSLGKHVTAAGNILSTNQGKEIASPFIFIP